MSSPRLAAPTTPWADRSAAAHALLDAATAAQEDYLHCVQVCIDHSARTVRDTAHLQDLVAAMRAAEQQWSALREAATTALADLDTAPDHPRRRFAPPWPATPTPTLCLVWSTAGRAPGEVPDGAGSPTGAVPGRTAAPSAPPGPPEPAEGAPHAA
ncbi:hypothetical protein CLV92_105247 [Kineococcus xinjiangensis]|uniref:Uncharacterized protein n=1 Tax=Kineococcus xinjiangensis TaxID=512762 RepID=A0A2S6IPP6_9ACTN|nr:hypothetical protein [Kineococcus xinjiangensis]PPK96145.1 hypothetical protein CLV92_105247 [Kineococcus xinjiangensis]